MPPKRKRAPEDAPAEPKTTRSTRSSAKKKAAVAEEGGASSSKAVEVQEEVAEPVVKKQRKTSTKAPPKKKTNANAKAAPTNIDDEPAGGQTSETTTSKSTKSAAATKAKLAVDPSKPQPYSAANATALFAEYADEDDEDAIGPEGLERLCSDANISLEGALPLIFAWQLGSSEMARVKKEEWDKGTGELRISSLPALSIALHDLENLLILAKPPLKPSAPSTNKKSSSADPYDRTRYFQYAQDTQKAYNELYLFLFLLTKPPQSKNIDMETACAFWSVAVAPRYPIMQDIITFITEKGTYKAVTKDLWNMMLEFCRTVSPDLSNFDSDGAWPSLLDDYVAAKKSSTGETRSEQ